MAARETEELRELTETAVSKLVMVGAENVAVGMASLNDRVRALEDQVARLLEASNEKASK